MWSRSLCNVWYHMSCSIFQNIWTHLWWVLNVPSFHEGIKECPPPGWGSCFSFSPDKDWLATSSRSCRSSERGWMPPEKVKLMPNNLDPTCPSHCQWHALVSLCPVQLLSTKKKSCVRKECLGGKCLRCQHHSGGGVSGTLNPITLPPPWPSPPSPAFLFCCWG